MGSWISVNVLIVFIKNHSDIELCLKQSDCLILKQWDRLNKYESNLSLNANA